MSIAGEDDLIIDLPFDGISTDSDAGEVAEEKKPKGTGGARPSVLARGTQAPTDDEIAKLRRERDEAARKAAEAEARAEQLAEQARAAGESRDKADARAETREIQAMRAHWEKLHSDKSQIEGAIAATKLEAAAAERDLASALESGNAERTAAAQRALARAEAVLTQLDSGLSGMDAKIEETKRLYDKYDRDRQEAAERKAKEPPPEPKKKEPDSPRTPEEWIDRVAKSALGDGGADWLREHKEFVTDAKLNRKMLRFADDYADDNGVESLKSKEFIAALNEKFFPDDTEDDVADDEIEVAPQQKRTTPSAPVSRSSPARPAHQGPGNRVRLNADEQAIATQLYPDMDRQAALKKYAANKARAIADGRYR